MNNLKQKNVIYGRDPKDVLPHGGAGDSVVLGQNSNITDIRINNAMQQLVNNDLYLENKIAAGLNYQVGPVRTSDEQAIAASPDGSKRWADSVDYTQPLQIYRKVDRPLSASIEQVRNVSVNCMLNVGDTLFIAFSDGLMYDAGGGLSTCFDETGAVVKAVGGYTCSNGTFFISDSAVYELTQEYIGQSGIKYSVAKISVGSIQGLKSVAYDPSDNMIYVADSSGTVMRGYYNRVHRSASFTADMKFCMDDVYGQPGASDRYFSSISVNAI